MAWKQISECLPAWLTAIEKGAGANAAPASECQGDTTLPVQEDDTSRRMTTAPTNGLPRPAVVIRLVVDNGGGGGRRQEEGTSAAYARAGGGNPASNLVVVVGGRDHCAALSITGVSIRSRNS
jgi:hypothetical protein